MSRKEEILQSALKLFNEGNTQSATTNHIAKEMEISPGNLHYHYKNREEIIRELYKQMRQRTILDIEELPQSLEELYEHQKILLKTLWEYRFFNEELIFLFSRDSELEKIYTHDNLLHRARIEKVVRNLISSGELEELDQSNIDFIVDSILMALQFNLPYLRTLGERITKKSIEKTINHTNKVFRPFLRAKTRPQQ